MTDGALRLTDVSTGYGDIVVVRGLSLSVPAGTAYLLLGRNGAGKTTLLHTIAGLLPALAGEVRVFGERVEKLTPDRRMRKGLALVQSEKRVFRRLTVEQNLRLGWYVRRRDRDAYRAALARAYERFPILRDRARVKAGLLSGGQQQMLAIAQALMPDPTIIMLDEPTAGLAPSIALQVLDAIAKLKAEGKAILLVEQAVVTALPIADHVGVMTQGHLGLSVAANELGDIDQIQHLYLGTQSEPTR